MTDRPIKSKGVKAKAGQTAYPDVFAQVVTGRTKRKLGDLFGLQNFGVNLTTLDPGAASALFHYHEVQDEFVFILEGSPTLVFGDDEYELSPGECMGFKAGAGIGHQLVNRTDETVVYVEVGDRTTGEQVTYPRDDIAAHTGPDGTWVFTHKDGTPY
ncbi:MAG: cupin domain-containing protein [Gammaproteobacteria bacterium]|jgi:uncharacterized cupin superfamily protein